jgi:hypothetical protein
MQSCEQLKSHRQIGKNDALLRLIKAPRFLIASDIVGGADSALPSVATSFCTDFEKDDEQLKKAIICIYRTNGRLLVQFGGRFMACVALMQRIGL